MGNLGWTEILVILGIALIIFGPRKLPELGKSLGQSLAQFRRASEDFKRTWETEVEVEKQRLNSFTPDTSYAAASDTNHTAAADSSSYFSDSSQAHSYDDNSVPQVESAPAAVDESSATEAKTAEPRADVA